MKTACGVLTPCCSQIGKVLSSRSRVTRGFTGLSSGTSECFGVRTCLRSVDLNAIRRAPCNPQRTAVIASIEHSEKSWQLGSAKVGLAFLAGACLLEGSASAESLPDLLVDAAGGNVNFVITSLCVAEAVALIGAIVGGVIARRRRDELYNINTQLRQINLSLRKQARVESYAPTLTYAPSGGRGSVAVAEPVDQGKDNLMSLLKSGKRLLREQRPAEAFYQFEKALELARKLNDTVEEKKAARGMGAACQRQKKYKEAIKYHGLVLAISEKTKEHSGNTEAYGAIGDCYSEIGEMESAAKYYDMYIDRLQNEDVD
ncbi:hypothetical protein KC19_12G059800 [Ceratodon purpureus]|uniref:Uncharacterized protein n=1 Tax=Ceratodon purpureus TaxID=3225 RepID=A0A8T0G861_CERPU|nr:hypothetical protein KC19_12G059800 [Ceratodon purpureus]KAG0554068.1 hypothetical protein KC19_12G059800 [Ceratodon purpureus]